MLLNPFIIKSGPPPPVDGDLEINYGSLRNSPIYQGVVNYYYEYSYSCHFIPANQLTSIPDGAHIYKIQFQVDNSTTGVYEEKNIDMWMAQVLPSSTEFPLNMRINLDSATDGSWNNQIFSLGRTKVISNGTRIYTQTNADPGIDRWVDIDFDFNFTYQAGLAICYSLLSSSGEYTPGSSSNPKHKGIRLSGTQPRLWCQGQSYTSKIFDTDFVNYDSTFRPNIKLFWN